MRHTFLPAKEEELFCKFYTLHLTIVPEMGRAGRNGFGYRVGGGRKNLSVLYELDCIL